ncbi:MAG: DUF1761 domain-containing protein [Rhizobiales bacterium]|nr:DUF1761 domain-containing protein [Hyphomicrobiales bacterium]
MTFAGVNYLAIFIAAVAGWITGAVWYGIFGQAWLAALGKTKTDLGKRKGTPAFYAPFVIAFIAALIMAWVLAGLIGHLGPGQVTLRNGVISGAFAWLGFVVTTIAVNYAFAMRKPTLTVIDAGHWLAELIVMGAIIGALGVR